MKKFGLSVVFHDNDKVTRDLKVEFVEVGDGKFQPVINVNDNETGFSTVTKLPISDYTVLRSKLDKIVRDLDVNDVEKLARKVTTLLSFVR